jgi:mRNA interferase MazF
VRPGDVALVRFPFTELATEKKRPALVLARTALSKRNRIATVAMITSQIDALSLSGDVKIAEWEAAGLLHPSLLRMAKVATIDEYLIDKRIGRLSDPDLKTAASVFCHVFAAWVD